jgi:hypothetical protein
MNPSANSWRKGRDLKFKTERGLAQKKQKEGQEKKVRRKNKGRKERKKERKEGY